MNGAYLLAIIAVTLTGILAAAHFGSRR